MAFPAYVNMVARGVDADIDSHLASCIRFAGCSNREIRITHVQRYLNSVTRGWTNGETCYRVEWTSYLGWKAYMMMTGCLASGPCDLRVLECGCHN
jgi:hypothetical protein